MRYFSAILPQVAARNLLWVSVLVVAGAVVACSTSSQDSGSSAPPAAPAAPTSPVVPMNTGTPPPVGTPTTQEEAGGASMVVQLVLPTLAPAPATAPVAHTLPTAVASVIASNCTTCHKTGGTSPDLTALTGSGAAATPAATLTGIGMRINNQGGLAPMPPSAPMAAADLQTVNSWLQSIGIGAATTTPATPLLASYTAVVNWSAAGTSGTQKLGGSTIGTYSVSLGQLPASTYVTANVTVTSPAGAVVLQHQYTQLQVPASGAVQLTVQLPAPAGAGAKP